MIKFIELIDEFGCKIRVNPLLVFAITENSDQKVALSTIGDTRIVKGNYEEISKRIQDAFNEM